MKIVLIAGIVIECIILMLLTLFKKWTRAAFLFIALLTVAGCVTVGVLGFRTQASRSEDDQRGKLYIAARLIHDRNESKALEALSTVDDEKTSAYKSRTLRALAYNLNGAYNAAQEYLTGGENSEAESEILENSLEGNAVTAELSDSITQEVISLIGPSDSEVSQWETEMKVRYLGFKLTDEEKTGNNNRITLVQDAITDNRTEEAYNLMMENPDGDQDAIIISQMYVYGYNNRIMSNTDEEYARLWKEAASLQAELNLAALDRPEQNPYDDEDGDELSEEEQKAIKDAAESYNILKARYELAQEELTQEAVKRSIKYMDASDQSDSSTATGRNLQMAQLYFMGHDHEKAREYLDKVFFNRTEDENEWLGSETDAFLSAFVLHLSDAYDNEYEVLFDALMNSLYQGVFRNNSSNDFNEFVFSYLKEQMGGLVIRRISTGAFPEVTVEVSSIYDDTELSDGSFELLDSGREIANYSFEQVDTSNLSVAFVLDRSGSMSGNYISDSKDAIKSCLLSLPDSIMVSFVAFDDASDLVTPLTSSKNAVLSSLDGIDARGGTDIADGMATAIDSLSSATGSRVIILLSDGQDSSDSMARMKSLLAEAAGTKITVYTIGLPGCNESYLQNIALSTGGQFIMVDNTEKLNQVYNEIQSAIQKSYIITYTAEDTDLQNGRSVAINDRSTAKKARKKYSLKHEEEEEETKREEVTEDTQKSNYYKQTGGTGERR